MAKAKMKPPPFSNIVIWMFSLVSVVYAQVNLGGKREVFFLNLEDGYFGCQVNQSSQILQLFELSKLCDGVPNCFLGSDENARELKCTNTCPYTQGIPCTNGACLDGLCHCNDGYGGCGCESLDENECKYRPCDIFSSCTNTLGSFYCTCYPGYEGDGQTCKDIDECQDPSVAAQCVENAWCCNLPAHYTCKCNDGYEGNGYSSCTDIDECANPRACGSNALCTNLPGNHTCTCPDGYGGNPYDGCVDIDECSSFSDPCGPYARCANRIGGHECLCPTGFEGDPYSRSGCVDINECARNPCAQGAICNNGLNNFTCACPPGNYGDAYNPSAECRDINECQRNPCAANAQCFDNVGSYTCQCLRGFTGDPYSQGCTDVDECRGQSQPCGTNAICRNTAPGYQCSCPVGFEPRPTPNEACQQMTVRVQCQSNYDCVNNAVCADGQCQCAQGFTEQGVACLDINECVAQPCGPRTTCTNIPGGYRCQCNLGLIGDPPSEPCRAPCDEVQCSAHATCKADGSQATCVCDQGWTFDPMDISAGCVDINECDTARGPSGFCGQAAICTNTPGSYRCQCPPGYTGNPLSGCSDIDECRRQDACGYQAVCSNTLGSYSCSCPQGTLAEPDPYTECLEIMTCQSEDDCPGNAMCLVGQCMCPEPNIGDDCRHPCEDLSCGNNAECKLINGVAKCLCEPGYAGNPLTLSGCADVDECQNNPCGSGAVCRNQPGLFICECPSGFEGNPSKDGCVEVKSPPQCGPATPCPSGEECILDDELNENVCVCQRGYTRDPSGNCRDFNECLETRGRRPCGRNANCKNLPGSYDCQCPEGFVGNPFSGCQKCNSLECRCQPPYKIVDGNCLLSNCSLGNTCPSGAECVTIQGDVSYCACPHGYTTLEDGSCRDVDECNTRLPDGSVPCGVNAECHNTVGNFLCKCPPGSSGDPYNNGCSQDSIQCASDNDCQTNEQCIEPGKCVCPPPFFVDRQDNGKCKSPCDAYACGLNSECVASDPPRCDCQQGFTSILPSGCVDVDECRQRPCATGAVCVNEIGTYKCECPAGSLGDPYDGTCSPPDDPPGCTSDDDCLSEQVCTTSSGECENPCETLPCGTNAYCEVESHVRFCRCQPGYIEGQNGDCVSLCDGFLCGQQAQCIVSQNGPTCKCEPGFLGNAFPGGSCSLDACSSSSPCADPQVCVNGRCKERCEGVVCGVGAKCDKQTNRCICLPNFLGDPDLLCVPPFTPPLCVPGCGDNAHCEYGLPNRCICNAGHSGNPYESCTTQGDKADCSTTKCGVNAKCRQGSNRVDCVCPVGYRGNPYVQCDDVDECIGNACGMNALCLNTVGSYDCRCQTGFSGNPFMMCMPDIVSADPCDANPDLCGCVETGDCKEGFVCSHNHCKEWCSEVKCGPNAVCVKGKCQCLPGFLGDANDLFVGCQVSECSNNQDCDDDEICFSDFGQRVCVEACDKVQCGPNTQCVTQDHRSSCVCEEGYVPIPSDPARGCQVEDRQNQCSTDTDCSQGQVCQLDFQGVRGCVDPCLTKVCDRNELCYTAGGRATCRCAPGFIHNSITNLCQKPSVPDCQRDSDCPVSSACRQDQLGVLKCVAVCVDFTCGLHSFCKAINHRGQCRCREGFTGNPNDRSGCRPIPQDECRTDTQCPETDKCIEHDGRLKCESVCFGVKCGPGAVCVSKNHVAQCQCPPGKFTGDPNDLSQGCTSVACLTDNHCLAHQACNRLNNECFDVCLEACGEGAVCIPESHKYNCKCPPGSRPSPSAKIACSTVDVCDPTPCHPSARCTVNGGSYTCSCPANTVGDAYSSGCYVEGTCPNGDSDCSSENICVNRRCVSPCDGACGGNAVCDVVNRKPVCRCPQGFLVNEDGGHGCMRIVLQCSSDAQCRGDVCIDGQCNAVCRRDYECAENEKCVDNMCRSPCISSDQCPSKQACIAGMCVIGCRTNSECLSDQACVNNKCIDPCSKPAACGPNAKCYSEGHVGRCECPAGFRGAPVPQQGCIRLPVGCSDDDDCPYDADCDDGLCMAPCRSHSQCAEGERCTAGQCKKVCFNNGNCLQGEVCIDSSCVAGCATKSDCLPNEVCLSNKCLCTKGFLPSADGCVDVDECANSPCDSTANCVNVPGSYKCSCPQGTVRDPSGVACIPPNECNADNDCPGDQTCRKNGGALKCVDICASSVCGRNAICKVDQRQPVCECLGGHFGDPNDLTVGCVQGECITDGDCQSSKACDRAAYKCIDPCDSVDCRYGRCRVENHKAVCDCQPGFILNPSTASCVDINECHKNPCHRSSECRNTLGSFSCSCPGNSVGDPYGVGCRSPGSCRSTTDCPVTAACIEGRCQNPCERKICGRNAKCRVDSHRAFCYCPPQTTGDASKACTSIECDDETSFCKPSHTCLNNKCVGLCSIPGSCGSNANCDYAGDSQVCSCYPGYTGDPNLGCSLVSVCASDRECPSGEQCNGGICVASCASNRECLSGQVCIGGKCNPTCQSNEDCPDLLVCQNNICVPEVKCRANSDCSSDEQCRQNAVGQAECQAVCDNLVLCGRNAVCVPVGHEPNCQCPEGYYGDPVDERVGCRKIQCTEDDDCGSTELCDKYQCKVACRVKNNCGQNALCQSEDHKAVCFCRNGFTGDPLRSCSAIDFCDDSPCGTGALCVNSRGSYRCSCPRGTVGNAYESCEKPPECLTHTDCHTSAYCGSEDDQPKCKDVCAEKECGANAECRAVQHEAVCSCRQGYEGHADHGCTPKVVSCSLISDCPPNTICDGGLCRPPCQSDSECDVRESCVRGQCSNLCDDDNACGMNAICNMVNHERQCSCPSGFTGQADVECYRLPSACRANGDCGPKFTCESGVCTPMCTNDRQCALNEKCMQGICLLTCRLDNDCFLGHICLNNMCSIGCRVHEDCAATEACINSQCSDPCRSGTVCGPNSQCSVENHRARCSCPSGFIPYPTPNTACVRRPVVCSLSSHCDKGFVCDDGNCAPICSSSDNCLSNEKCDGQTCRPVCSRDDDCRSGQICSNAMCISGCRANSECLQNQACVNRQCGDPCESPTSCGSHAQCSVEKHQATCTCPPGFEGDAYNSCRRPPTACSSGTDCSSDMSCVGGTCKPRCSSDQSCLDNERCIGGVCKEICSSSSQCEPGHICVGRICIAGCRSDSSCPSDQACINRQCRDPCERESACGACAVCKVVNNRAHCSCPANTVGLPSVSCRKPQKSCPDTQRCASSEICEGNLCFETCSSNDDCSCGMHCSSSLCRPRCKSNNECAQGFLCEDDVCVVGCRSNTDCPVDKACVNNKCESLCSDDTCGVNAECKASDHRALCLCPNGFRGDAYASCTEDECDSDDDCTSEKACIDGDCRNPCLNGQCGTNAQCKVNDHEPICYCPTNYYGNPTRSCKRDVNECLRSPCGNNARCENTVGSYTCLCDTGCTGDPYEKGCLCPLNFVDPCTNKKCGDQAQCRIIGDDVAQCFCPPEFPRGDPSRKCVKEDCRTTGCGLGANCETTSAGFYDCACRPTWNGDPYVECSPGERIQCHENDECPLNAACIENKCVNPCAAQKPCPPSKKCSVVNHLPVCVCEEGCSPSVSICLNDRGCPTSQACVNYQCVDPCESHVCPGDSPCYVEDHQPLCKFCPAGFTVRENFGCQPETPVANALACSGHSDCDAHSICNNNGYCTNPCTKQCATPTCRIHKNPGRPLKIVCIKQIESTTESSNIAKNLNPPFPSSQANQVTPPPALGTTTKGHNWSTHKPSHSNWPSTKGLAQYTTPSSPTEGSTEAPREPSPCSGSMDCQRNEVCTRGRCENPCDALSPCDSGFKCKVISHRVQCLCATDGQDHCKTAAGCRANSDCPQKQACINELCQNPCVAQNPCDPNDDCKVQGQSAICVTVGCRSNSACPSDEACINKQCISPCEHRDECQAPEECQVRDHIAFCVSACSCKTSRDCTSGHICDGCTCRPVQDEPCTPSCRVGEECDLERLQCVPVSMEKPECERDTDCLSNQVCDRTNRRCIDPCDKNPCTINAVCTTRNRRPDCVCKPGFSGNGFIECSVPADEPCDANCPSNLICVNNKCINPCNCGLNAMCELANGIASCRCPPGYLGDPLDKCSLAPPRNPCDGVCGTGALCELDQGRPVCRCPTGTTGNPFSKCIPYGDDCDDDYCGPNSGCRLVAGRRECFCLPEFIGDPPREVCHRPKDQCDPSPCGPNTNCYVVSGRYTCTCQSGYVGNPNTIRGCDSPINPCDKRPCGTKALCNPSGSPLCYCRPGLVGDPYTGCKDPPPSCKRNSCGPNAECYVSVGEIKCRCLRGYSGRPDYGCVSEPRNPCDSNPCGNNAECRLGSAGQVVCSCLPYFTGNPNSGEQCKAECTRNTDCDSDKACMNQRCQDPCPGACGLNSDCKVVSHRPVCICKIDHSGDPYVFCSQKPLIPITPVARDPCQPSPCGPGTQCRVVAGEAVCMCQPGYFGEPYEGCKPECVTNDDCPEDKSCRNRRCRDPCPGLCGLNAVCEMDDHIPICFCAGGFTGDPYFRCFEEASPPAPPEPKTDPCSPNPCGRNSQCRVTNDGQDHTCICAPGFFGSPCRPECTISSDCALDKACSKLKCIDPCLGACGLNSQCRVVAHTPVCTCPEGYTGDPYSSCRIKPSAEDPDDVEECTPSCGINANCQVEENRARCVCLPGYHGSPYTICTPQCTTNDQCSPDTTCINHHCKDPCVGACGRNAECRVQNHRPSCSCSHKYSGDPYTLCTPIPITPITPVSVEPCDPNPCGSNAECHYNGQLPQCRCPVGMEGNPLIACGPDCTSSSQCHLTRACINNKCVDPCPGSCGRNAQCIVVSHQPVCSCPPGYIGQPHTACRPKPTQPAALDPCDKCGPRAKCLQLDDSTATCVCPARTTGDPYSNIGCEPECYGNNDCPLNHACRGEECTDPCEGACASTAECFVVNHSPVCVCPEGFQGSPLVRCYPKVVVPITPVTPEITNPCENHRCGINAYCTLDDGKAVCECDELTSGNPDVICSPECLVNSDCPANEACSNRKCYDPCPGPCGDNAECFVLFHQANCACEPTYTGDPYQRCYKQPVAPPIAQFDPCSPNPCGPNSNCEVNTNRPVCTCKAYYYGEPPRCRPECVANPDCPRHLACSNFKCEDPCIGTCGVNAKCEVVNHSPVCYCPPDLQGDPYKSCAKAVIPITPITAPCEGDPCGPNAICKDTNGRPVCTCLEYYFGNPPNCRPECVVNSECPPHLVCLKNRCQSPCEGLCGVGAECRVKNHKPLCECTQGYQGDPYTRCTPVPLVTFPVNPDPVPIVPGSEQPSTMPDPVGEPSNPDDEPDYRPCLPDPCGSNAICKATPTSYSCVCKSGFFGDPYSNCGPECVLNSDCGQRQSCENRKCVNACPGKCAPSAECRVVNHGAVCRCPDGFTGNPTRRCYLQPIAVTTTPAPIEPQAMDVCDPNPCGDNAECIRNGLHAHCRCLDDYSGNPYDRCRPECENNDDCPFNKACNNEKCIDPCPGTCSQNSKCLVVMHIPQCTCDYGYSGDPYESCTPIIEKPKPAPRPSCDSTSCGPNARCRIISNVPTCYCLPGYFGQPPNCRPECVESSQCISSLACIKKKCQDPCPGSCGVNAICEVDDHNPICSCARDMTGDPYVQCRPFPLIPVVPLDVCKCGENAECITKDGDQLCKCVPKHYGNPYVKCKPECVINSDCPNYLACDDLTCVDPCKGTCGIGAYCQVHDHSPQCECPPGMRGDPMVRCQPYQQEEREPDRCIPNPCGPYTECRNVLNSVVCTCLPGYPGTPDTSCKPDCTINSDCELSSACINRLCVDPCAGSCHPTAECHVRNHHPSCFCPSGYIGDPQKGCMVKPVVEKCPDCGKNARCVEDDDRYVCKCYADYYGNPYSECRPECTINPDCPRYLACVNLKCVDPCPGRCGVNALCDVINHEARCTCPPDTSGDPYLACAIPSLTTPIGCTTSGECNPKTACIENQCQDPCALLDPCAENAECYIENHRPVCSCAEGYSGSPTKHCFVVGCKLNTECPSDGSCINKRCDDPCDFVDCGESAECRVVDQKAQCYCPHPLKGNPYRRCYYPECTVDEECPSFLACMNEKCGDPCNCPSSAECRVVQHRPQCYCPVGYTGDANMHCYQVESQDVIGCIVDGDCPSGLGCFAPQCKDPCSEIEPCGRDAECSVVNSLPYRTMTCSCPPGYLGDPYHLCYLPPKDKIGCTTNDDCDRGEQCRNNVCIDPCALVNPCAVNAECIVRDRQPVCSCPSGLTGDPRINCYTTAVDLPECTKNSDCATDMACYDQKCADPCIVEDPCGRQALCRVTEHIPICYCPDGFFGNPTIRCYRAQCSRDEDCPTDKACMDNRCVNPCTYDGNDCGAGALCRVVVHKEQCHCPVGTQGNPKIACVTVACLSNDDCADTKFCSRENRACIDVCEASTCAPQAECKAANHAAMCNCLPGYHGNPFVGCFEPREPPVTPQPLKPQCQSDSDCPLREVCTNELCRDPCLTNPCAPTQVCRVVQSFSYKTIVCECPPNQILFPGGNCVQPTSVVPECTRDENCANHEWCREGTCRDVCLSRPCGNNAICHGDQHLPQCTCAPGFYGNPTIRCERGPPLSRPPPPECEENDDCPDDNSCVNQICVNPCSLDDPCARNAFCFVTDHEPVCRCPDGFTGDPRQECLPIDRPINVGCRAHSDCPAKEACINSNCVEPCNCGANAECDVIDHRPVCTCLPGYFGHPQTGCYKAGCERNEHCPTDKMCLERVCVNPCYVEDPCAITAECYAHMHEAKCRCPEGLQGDPFVACELIGCRSNPECPTDRACVNRQCIDPCLYDNMCAPNAQCYVFQHVSGCRCPPEKPYGDPRVMCEEATTSVFQPPPCRSDGDCPSQHACIDAKCVNPCYYLDPCVETAHCKVIDSLPVRTMVCICPEGFIMTEQGVCEAVPPRITAECRSDSDCPEIEACINRQCKSPCECGPNAECDVVDHRAVCRCQAGFGGVPDRGCFSIGCTINYDCPEDMACYDGVCANPCYVQDPCAADAECFAAAHTAHCRCPLGFLGTGYDACIIAGCRSDSSCPVTQACVNSRCIDPCLDDPCGPDSECVSVDHQAACRCPIGTFGDPRVSCKLMPREVCYTDGDCASQQACLDSECVNPCAKLDPCHDSATCKVVDTLPYRTLICVCPEGMVIEEDGSCRTVVPLDPICTANEDCPPQEACRNGFCKVACQCGVNADCEMAEHHAVCSCKPGFEGDPEIRCDELLCRVDEDCSTTHACVNNQCRPVCGPDNEPCGDDATCLGINHEAQCVCGPGLMGNPNQECNPIGCEDNSNCPDDRACVNSRCVDPCALDDPCIAPSECTVQNHVSECPCPPGHNRTIDNGCEMKIIGCLTDSDCPELACVNRQCTSICALDPCGINTKCEMSPTLPYRKTTCVCLPGYQGYAFEICNPVPVCPIEKGYRLSPEGECVCPQEEGFYVDQNGNCVLCPLEKGFILTADGRCICDVIKGYVIDPNEGVCKCPLPLTLSPTGVCVLAEVTPYPPECEINEDCSDDKMCRNNVCVPPCSFDPCSKYSTCLNTNHTHVCYCLTGYSGDPYVPDGCQIPIVGRTDFPRPSIVVNCLADGVLVDINVGDPGFNGVMYVKGYSKNPECRKILRQDVDVGTIDFKVEFNSCGLVHEDGLARFVLVIQKHPKLVTYKAQAYHIKCTYSTGEKTISMGFNVSMLSTAGTIANTGPPPRCLMKITNQNGGDIAQAEIGDLLLLRIEVEPSDIYGGFARSCVALTSDDEGENEYIVTDENGCSTDAAIFQEWSIDNTRALVAPFSAFKFPSSNSIRFQCNVRVCFGRCQPVNCNGYDAFGKRRRRQAVDPDAEFIYSDESTLEGQLREIQVQSQAILTVERRSERLTANQDLYASPDEVCVSKWGFIIALVITALLALVAVAVAVSCWLMAYRRRPQYGGPLPHPDNFPNPLFTTPEPLAEPSPDYFS